MSMMNSAMQLRAIKPTGSSISLAMEGVLADLKDLPQPVVGPDDSLEQCRKIFEVTNAAALIVVDPLTNVPLGRIDASALLGCLRRRTRQPDRAAEMMQPCTRYLATPRRPSEALAMMESQNLTYLIFVSNEGEFKGVITRADLHARNTQRLREQDRQINEVLNDMRQEISSIQNENAEVMGVLAHDLRGPLGGIQGLSSLIARDCEQLSLAQIKEFTLLITQEAEHLVKLTNDVLELARNCNGNVPLQMRNEDPVRILTAASQIYYQLAKRKEIRFVVNLPQQPLPQVLMDRERMQTVLTNLMDNAVKYSRPGDSVTVGVRLQAQSLSYIVTDTGQGLPKEEFGKLFVRFGRGSSRPTAGEPSSGLGLAITREIVRAHGGDITVSGDKGVGLTFVVSLPLHDTGEKERSDATKSVPVLPAIAG